MHDYALRLRPRFTALFHTWTLCFGAGQGCDVAGLPTKQFWAQIIARGTEGSAHRGPLSQSFDPWERTEENGEEGLSST